MRKNVVIRITIIIIQIIRQEQRKVLFNIHYSGCKIQIIQMVGYYIHDVLDCSCEQRIFKEAVPRVLC